jgi:Flp pilus assembly protein TadB
MKKLLVCVAATLLLLAFAPIQSKAEAEAIKRTASAITDKTESVEVQTLINRVNEINAMDKSAMSSTEKKMLRKELRSLKMDANNHSHNHGGGTIYISGGVILLIIILIIIL